MTGHGGVTRGARRLLVAALAAIWVLVSAALFVARWPTWWAWIAPEQTPMTWVQSVVLVLASVGSLVLAHLLRLIGAQRRVAWLVLAAGFAALAVDERFALHERIRDGYLAPRGVTVPFLPWVAPGDFLVLAIAATGLAVLPMVWRAVRDDAASRAALVVAVALAAMAVGMDSIDPSTWTAAAERVQQTAEEVVELGSGLAFLAAVGLRLLGMLGAVTSDEASREDAATAPHPAACERV